jgi:hypothetical protein
MQAYFKIADELADMGLDLKEQIYPNLPKAVAGHGGGVRVGLCSINGLKVSDPARKKMMDFLFSACANNKPVDVKELQKASGLPLLSSWTDTEFREHYMHHTAEMAISNRISSKKRYRKFYKNFDPDTSSVDSLLAANRGNETITQKLRLLNALSIPLYNHCEKMNRQGFGDNPYAALPHLVKFWNEGHP